MLLDLEIFDITIQVLVHSLDLITECLTHDSSIPLSWLVEALVSHTVGSMSSSQSALYIQP